MDGRVLDEMFVTAPHVARVAGAPRPAARHEETGLTAEEEAEVVERLRALGYME